MIRGRCCKSSQKKNMCLGLWDHDEKWLLLLVPIFERDCKSAIVKPQVNLLPTNKDWSVCGFPLWMQEVGC